MQRYSLWLVLVLCSFPCFAHHHFDFSHYWSEFITRTTVVEVSIPGLLFLVCCFVAIKTRGFKGWMRK